MTDTATGDIRYTDRMSNMDAMMWRMEKDPVLRSTITALFVMESAPDRDALVDKLDRASRLVPRLRQRVVGNPFSLVPPRWEYDPNFDLGYHVRSVRAPGNGTIREVLDMAEPLAMAGFDRARPLWEFTVVEGMEGGRSGAIFKLNHAVSDGVGLIAVAPYLIDLEADPKVKEPMPPAPEGKVLNPYERLVDGIQNETARQRSAWRRRVEVLRQLGAHPLQEAQSLRETVRSLGRVIAPETQHLSDLLARRSLSVQLDVMEFGLDDLKRAAKVAGGKLNDAFVAAVAAALGRYHEAMGSPVRGLRMAMPINVRSGENANLAGNQFVPARFTVPVNVADPVERMKVVRNLVVRERREPALELMEPLATVVNRVPSTLVNPFFGSVMKCVDFFTSNVPGLPFPVYSGGAKLEAVYPFGPLAGAAANLTLVSYQDRMHLGVNSDPAAFTDRPLFLECLKAGFDEILALG